MKKCLLMVAAAMMAATSLQAQTKRSDNFKAKCFSAGILSFANVEIQHKYDEDAPTAVISATRDVMILPL